MKFVVKTTQGQSSETIVKSNKVTLGRSNKCDVVIKDGSLSRNHCEIELENGNFFITDLASVNGVYIDGVRITASVRTPFNSFNQLHLATVECQVEDNEFEAITNPNISIPSALHQSEDKTSATQMMSTRMLNKTIEKSHPPAKKQAPLKSYNMGLVLPVLLFFGVAYYSFQTEPGQKTELPQAKAPTPPVPEYKKLAEKIKATPNDFLLPSEYEQLNQSKSCSGMEDLCKNLKLDDARYEGISKKGDDFVVFVNPSIRLENERYLAMKEAADIQELISMDLILSSEIMNRYYTGQTNQIHVIINDGSGKSIKVYRFHPLKFPPGKAPRIKLLEELNQSFFTKNSQPFWETLGESVPSYSLTN